MEHLENIIEIRTRWKELPMLFATALTFGLIAFVASMLVNLARQDGLKIAAALQGRSWASGPLPASPVTVRFSPRYTAARPERVRTALRAAA
jgi:hypothetical protein